MLQPLDLTIKLDTRLQTLSLMVTTYEPCLYMPCLGVWIDQQMTTPTWVVFFKFWFSHKIDRTRELLALVLVAKGRAEYRYNIT
jgi:hypothetical protein